MKKFIFCCLLMAALFNVLSVGAQTMDIDSASQLKKLLQLKGYWEAKAANMKMAGKEFTFIYYADFKTTAANNGLTMHEWCTVPGIGKLDGANLIGVDPIDGKVHWFSVDNMGTTHDHTGEFSDSRHFKMNHINMQDNKEYIETITLEFVDASTLKLNLAATLDGKEDHTISATFHRKASMTSK